YASNLLINSANDDPDAIERVYLEGFDNVSLDIVKKAPKTAQELIAGLKVYRTALEKIKDGNSQPWNYTWRKGNMEYTEKWQQRKRLNFNERYRTTESLTHLMFELAICFKLYFATNK